MTPLSSACRSKMIDFEQRVAGVSGLGASRLMLCWWSSCLPLRPGHSRAAGERGQGSRTGHLHMQEAALPTQQVPGQRLCRGRETRGDHRGRPAVKRSGSGTDAAEARLDATAGLVCLLIGPIAPIVVALELPA